MFSDKKRTLRKTRMRTKFLLVTILTVGFFMGFSLYKSIGFQYETAMTQVEKSSHQLMENTYSSMIFPMSVGDGKTVEEQFKKINEQMKGVKVYIADFNQDISYASVEGELHESMAKHLHSPESIDALRKTLTEGIAPEKSLRDTIKDEPCLVTFKPILNDAPCYHCHTDYRKVLGAIIVKQSIVDVIAAIEKSRNLLILISLIALVGIVLSLYFLFQKLVTKRVIELKEVTNQVTAGDVSVKLTVGYEDSLGQLARNFNEMVKSIRDRIEYANSLKLGISDPFFMVDPEMTITYINRSAARLLGVNIDDALGKTCRDVFKSDVCDRECPLKDVMNSNKAVIGKRVNLQNADGRHVPVLTSASVLKDSTGKILGGFEIIRDLTTEVEAEQQLQQAYLREEQSKNILEKKAKRLFEILRMVAHGDLSRRAAPDESNDIMNLMTISINDTLEGMVSLISEVKSHILPVMGGVDKIGLENKNLSSRTEQQAEATEEISATLVHLVQNTKELLDKTQHADSLSKEAVTVAHDGGNLVTKTSQAMKAMSEASQKIVEMMELINEITFQTNLLSVNAAVEAARAGEHGRGFSAVADEVRNLAKRSSSSAKDIDALVRKIMESASTARLWVDELNEYFIKIVQASNEVTKSMVEITALSEMSSGSIGQIHKGVHNLCEVNEMNYNFVEQIKDETLRLQQNVDQLREITEVFILPGPEIPMQKVVEPKKALPFVHNKTTLEDSDDSTHAADLHGQQPAAHERKKEGKKTAVPKIDLEL